MRSYNVSKVISRLLSVLVLSGVLFAFVDSSRPAIWAQEADGGKIAYIGQDDNVWLVNADGSEPRQITFDAGEERGIEYGVLRWSPDGSRLAFARHEEPDTNTLILTDHEGTTLTPVLDVFGDRWDFDFDWSPGSDQIVYSEEDGLYVLDLQTLQSTLLMRSQSGMPIIGVDWSPDGTMVAFYENIPPVPDTLAPSTRFGVFDIASRERIWDWDEYVFCRMWAPDSSMLGCEFWYMASELMLCRPDGTLVRTLPGAPFPFIPPMEYLWSPDGRYISVWSCNGHFGEQESVLTLLDLRTDELQTIPISANTSSLPYPPYPKAWSPSSSYLLVLDISSSTLYSVDVVSGEAREIARGVEEWGDTVDWQPAIQRIELDLGFRPDPNGYQFANKQLLRSLEMFEQFFGTENVRHPDGNWCEAAKQFFWGTHPDMPESWKGKGYRNVADGWSCVGFSLSSLLSYLDQPQPQAGPFAIAHYEQLYRHTEPDQFTASIAYYSGVQTGKQYVDAFRARMDHCDTDPNRKINDIEEGILNREPVIVLLNTFTDLGYHALVPYRVESVSSTETTIYVYDSEAPGEEHVIHFAHSGDEWHWTYTFMGSIAKAAGTATGQCEDLFLYPIRTSVEQGDPPVVFCESQGATSGVKALQSSDRSHRVLAQLPAEGDWVMRDNLGRRLGWVKGMLVSEIPDAFHVPQALGDVSLSYRILYLPEGEYTVELTDSPTDEFGYTLFGDGRFIEVAGHLRSPGSGVGLSITPGLDQARLSETQNLTSFTLTLDSERTTESRVATVAGASLTGSGDLSVGFDGDQLMVSRGDGSLHYSPGLEKSDGQHFASEPLTLEGNETHTMSPIDWSELGSASVVWEVDDDSDGTIDETLVLEDQASVPMPTPTTTVSPENGKGKGFCPGSLAMIWLVGLTLIGLTRRSMLR